MTRVIEYLHYFSLATMFLFAFTIILWYAIYFWYSSYFKKLQTFGPITPCLGIALKALNAAGLYHELRKDFNNKGQTLFSMIGPRPVIITIEPKFIEMLCNSKRVQKSQWVYPLARNFLGKGLIIAEGEPSKIQRKLLAPAFHYNILQRNVTIFNDYSNTLMENLEKELNDDPIEISKYSFKYALGIIFESTIGLSYNTIEKEMPTYISGVKDIIHIIYTRLVNPFHYFDLTYRFCKDYQIENKLVSNVHSLVDTAIELKKQVNNINNKSNGEHNNEKPLLLDILLKNNDFYNHQLLREEVNTMLYAGTDTNATTLSYALYMLSKHSEIQEKVFQEMCVIQKNLSGRSINLNDVSKMQYLHMVLLETLRLGGTVPYIVKEFTEPTVYDGVTYPKGVPIIIAIYALHRDTRHYKNPDKFIPERHLPENTKNMEQYSFIPFSGGPRNCIGQRYSLLALKIFIYKLLLKFELLPVKDHQIQLAPEIIMVSKNGFKIHMKRRTYKTQ